MTLENHAPTVDRTEEQVLSLAASNAPAILIWILGLLCVLSVVLLPVGILLIRSVILVNPNQAKVLLLFGKYVGTVRRSGLFVVNPLTNKREVSLRVRNFDSARLKVNDHRGNPIEIAAVVVWRVHNTAQAVFDVEDYESYVAVQTESAIRSTATKHPYDSAQPGEVSLRDGSDQVNAELKHQLDERLALAGIEVLEARISHLAYAPEIAGAMLRRQQAEAIIDARARIVEGAVSMVKMALEHLSREHVITMDERQKAAMVSNLLVVLCAETETHPVVSAGTPAS